MTDTWGPLGETVEAKFTVPEKPLRLVSVIVDVPVEPCITVREVGLTERVKSDPVTVTVTLAEWDGEPPIPVPVTVTV